MFVVSGSEKIQKLSTFADISGSVLTRSPFRTSVALMNNLWGTPLWVRWRPTGEAAGSSSPIYLNSNHQHPIIITGRLSFDHVVVCAFENPHEEHIRNTNRAKDNISRRFILYYNSNRKCFNKQREEYSVKERNMYKINKYYVKAFKIRMD